MLPKRQTSDSGMHAQIHWRSRAANRERVTAFPFLLLLPDFPYWRGARPGTGRRGCFRAKTPSNLISLLTVKVPTHTFSGAVGYGGDGIYIELENEVFDDLFFNNPKLIESDAIWE